MKTAADMPRASRPVARAERAAECSRLLAASMDRHDVTQEEIAAALGVAQCTISRVCSRHSPDSLALHDVAHLPDAVAVDVLRPVVALLGYALAQLPIGDASGGDLRMLANAAREHGEALAAYVSAAESGARGDIEGAIRETDEAIGVLAAMRARLEAKRGEVVRCVPRAVAR